MKSRKFSIFNSETWILTGDLGHRDDDGSLWLHARRDDLIVTGGENVRPRRWRRRFSRIPTWRRHASWVCPTQCGARRWRRWSHPASARYTPDIIAALEAHCRALLAGYNIPRTWYRVAQLPRIGGMKTNRGTGRRE